MVTRSNQPNDRASWLILSLMNGRCDVTRQDTVCASGSDTSSMGDTGFLPVPLAGRFVTVMPYAAGSYESRRHRQCGRAISVARLHLAGNCPSAVGRVAGGSGRRRTGSFRPSTVIGAGPCHARKQPRLAAETATTYPNVNAPGALLTDRPYRASRTVRPWWRLLRSNRLLPRAVPDAELVKRCDQGRRSPRCPRNARRARR